MKVAYIVCLDESNPYYHQHLLYNENLNIIFSTKKEALSFLEKHKKREKKVKLGWELYCDFKNSEDLKFRNKCKKKFLKLNLSKNEIKYIKNMFDSINDFDYPDKYIIKKCNFYSNSEEAILKENIAETFK